MLTKKELERAWELRIAFKKLYGKGLTSIENSSGLHLDTDAFKELAGDDYSTAPFDSKDYPFEHTAEIDGIKVFCITKRRVL